MVGPAARPGRDSSHEGPRASRALLEAIRRAQARFIEGPDPGPVFEGLLEALLALTRSEYGFLGEVLHRPGGEPYLKTHAASNLAWDEHTRASYEAGLEFTSLHSLLGSVLTTGRPVLANDPAHDPRAGGLPPGHPRLTAFLGVPFFARGGEMVGMVGIANRPGGYDEGLLAYLGPFLTTCAALVTGLRAHAERQQAQDALRHSQQQYAALVHSLDGIVWEADPRTRRCTFVSPQAERILGHPPAEWLSRPDRWLELVHPEDRDSVARRYHACLAAGSDLRLECRMVASDGRIVWFRHHLTVVAEGGTPVKVRGLSLDVSERKRLEEQFRQAQKMEAVGRLAGGVAHDFNNLLTIINGYGALLLEGLPAGHSCREPAQEVVKAGERAASLTRQLLAFGRKQMLTLTAVNLNAVVGGMEKMLARVLGEDVRLSKVLDPDLGPVKTDLGQIEQVLLNLAVNARDAMPSGGELTIATRNAERDEAQARANPELPAGAYAVLEVTDTGCGMTEEVQAHLFEPFFTTKEVGKGTGLGLATVYGIVKQSGGHVEARSAVGRGSTFTIYLPRIDQPVPPPAPGQRPESAPRGEEVVLLVEDEDALRVLARRVLEGNGYAVLEARNGPEALALSEARDGPVHLLLTDVVMPGMSGRVLAARLAGERPGLRVLYMTGYADGVLGGPFDCEPDLLLKPFTPLALARRVRAALDRPAVGPGSSGRRAVPMTGASVHAAP
jgi:two-component system, cell cycle sensor histidine kinase and response regulator CckA